MCDLPLLHVQLAEEFHVPRQLMIINMIDMGNAMRRPGLLLRVDESYPHAVGRVLATIALLARTQASICRSVLER
jgi:hypothetical protein